MHSPDLTFGTRTGSRKGVEAHLFRAETPRELAHWCRSIIEGAHSAAALIKEINCGETDFNNHSPASTTIQPLLVQPLLVQPFNHC